MGGWTRRRLVCLAVALSRGKDSRRVVMGVGVRGHYPEEKMMIHNSRTADE